MRLLFILLCLLPLFLNAQNAVCPPKVDPKLWALAQKPDSAVEFLIIMEKKGDVSGARHFRKKEDKGRYVYETLSALAEKEQRNVRDLLQNEGAPLHSFWIINALWAKGNAALLEKIAQLPEVGRLKPNPVWHLNLPPLDDASLPAQERALNPWGLSKIKANDVWNLGYKGDGIVIGGQDTGYEWEHPAIKEKYRGWDGSNANHNYNWHDAIHALINGGSNSCGLDLNHPCDDHDHGTHTMGTMVGGPAADSIIGVAPEATWIGCRNMEEGDGTPATYIECFEWFVMPTDLNDLNPDASKAPHVINNSWGCPVSEGCDASNYDEMEDVVNNVREAGIVVVVSAGNSGPNCSTVDSPAAIYDASISVGATNSSDNIANFSSRGPVTVYTAIMKPDISAPGVNVASCIGHDNNDNSYTYASWNGTSMAGPHVAGVAALIMDARPDLIGDVDAIENAMIQNAVERFAVAPFCGSDNGSSVPNNVYGWGRVNALDAVNAALPIELLGFEVRAVDKTAQLSWFTASEINCEKFVVQRSADGFSWKNIGESACKANDANTETAYYFTDPDPLRGINYYRIEQFDYSGLSSKSPVRALSFATSGFSLRLLAGKGSAYFEVLGEGAGEVAWHMEIRSTDGRELYNLGVGAKGWLTLPSLPNGIYLLILRDTNGRVVAVEKWFWVN